MQGALEESAGDKRKNVLIIVKNGLISREFVASLSDVLLCAKDYNVQTYMSGADYFDSDMRKFCEQNGTDLLVFVQPTVGFGTDAIAALVADCSELDHAHSCVAVPLEGRSYHKVLSAVKERGPDALDERSVESLTSVFDISVRDKKIHLDSRGRFECDGFQPHDIVCAPLATVSAGDNKEIKKFVHTTFTTSNNGTRGCLLDHLKHIDTKS